MTGTVRRERRITPVVRRLLKREMHAEVETLLQVDTVLTDAQLARRGLSGEGFPSITLTIRPMPRGTRELPVTFRALTEARLFREASSLTHLAGTAELRARLSAAAECWHLDHGGRFHRPDATWRTPDGDVAVEYDAGYTLQVARRKVRAFGTFREIVWGTPSALRASRLQVEFPGVDVRVLDYWSAHT